MAFHSGALEVGEEGPILVNEGSDEMEMGDERRASGYPLVMFGKVLGAVAALSGAVLAISHSTALVSPASVRDVTGLEQIVVQGPRDGCSPPWTSKSKAENKTENCFNTQCCSVTGFNCFQIEAGVAGCLNGCTPKEGGFDCTMPHGVLNLVEAKEVPNRAFYCFALHTQDTGNPGHHPGPEDELALLREQYDKKVGVFACAGHDVFADVEVNIGEGLDAIKVDDVLGEFHLSKRKKTKTWVNTGIFKQVWKQIEQRVNLNDYGWIIKLDADAVFVPQRLEKMLSAQLVSMSGVYLENCAEVQTGFFGNIEVFSRQAFATLVANIDSCSSQIDWPSPQATAWGPIGEDLFAQKCMDLNGVSKIQNFELTTDGACPRVKKMFGQPKAKKPVKPECEHVTTPVMHPFKTVGEWFDCYQKTTALDVE